MKKSILLISILLFLLVNESNAIAPKYWRLNSISAKAGIVSSKAHNDYLNMPDEHYVKIFFYPSVSVNFFKRECIQHKIIASYQRTTLAISSFNSFYEDSDFKIIEFINGAYVISLFPPNKKVYPYLDLGPFVSVHIQDNVPWGWSDDDEFFNKISGGLLTNLGLKYEHSNFDIFIEISRNGYIVPVLKNHDFDDGNFEYWINSYSTSLGISLKF